MSITTVTAVGEVCLPNIGMLAADLRDALDKGGAVQLDLSQTTALDLSVLQLVQSARVTAARTGSVFELTHPAGTALLETLERAGLLTRLSPEDTSFWFHGDTAQ